MMPHYDTLLTVKIVGTELWDWAENVNLETMRVESTSNESKHTTMIIIVSSRYIHTTPLKLAKITDVSVVKIFALITES